MPFRVLIVDDDADVRSLMARLLARHGGWEVVGEVGDGSEVIEAVRRLEPHVVLLDLQMATPGDVVVPQLVRLAPSCMVTVVSGLPAATHRDRLLRLGAFSYIEKDRLDDLGDILESHHASFRQALDGEDVVAPWAHDAATAV